MSISYALINHNTNHATSIQFHAPCMTCMIKLATPSTHLWYVCLSNMQIPSGIKIQPKRIPLVDLPMIGCNWQQMHDHRRLVRNVLA